MPAYKALFILIVVGAVVAFGAFTFVPSLRPGFVKKWYFMAAGFTTAQTPTEALEKYRSAIKQRNYEAALLYTGGDYHEQLKIGADAAAKLGKAIDDVMYTFKNTKNLKNDKVEYALTMLDPFPTEFVVDDVKTDKKDENLAVAMVSLPSLGKQLGTVNMSDWKVDPNIWLALVPNAPKMLIQLKKEKVGKDDGWIIYMDVSPALRKKVQTLKDYHGNYAHSLRLLNDELKNDQHTVENFERDLKRELEAATK
jgi:hypothetical protein